MLTTRYDQSRTTVSMIDTERIAELQAEIGPEDLSHIVSIYLEEARATLNRIERGLSIEDHARAVHFLRSGALNIGLRGIADLAAQLTCTGSANRDPCARRLDTALDRTMTELENCMT